MDHRVNQRVATRIVGKLSESGRSNSDLADHLNISEATLLRRLTSQTSFTVTEVAHVAKFFGCGLVDLIPMDHATKQSA